MVLRSTTVFRRPTRRADRRLQVICDDTDSNTAGVALGYANRITSDYARQMLAKRIQRARGVADPPVRIDSGSRAWFNENLQSRNYFVPGVIVIVVSLVSLLLTSMAVVREKEIGTIEQIMVTPITPAEFILGKTLPFVLIAFVDVTLILLIGSSGSRSRSAAASCSCTPRPGFTC